jgi:dihydroorotate dehydrogenase
LGPGFLEIGTITPRPQRGHVGKRLKRNTERRALWNRMGFPSQGVEAVIKRLKNLYQPRFTLIFANIGKNAATPIESAVDDYLTCLHLLNGLVDAFVINVSSPNTQGLRTLLTPERLRGFLEPLVAGARETHGKSQAEMAPPLLLKISPDLGEEQLSEVLLLAVEIGLDGFVLTNSSSEIRQGLTFPEEGGVSGAPLANARAICCARPRRFWARGARASCSSRVGVSCRHRMCLTGSIWAPIWCKCTRP